MKYWFDCEFEDNGKTIELISIGFVSEDYREYYAESSEYDRENTTPWLKENVIPLLNGPVKSRKEIADDLIRYLGDWPEIWGWYGSYDWVCLCQLYGTMMDLPKNWPMYQLETMNMVTKDTPRADRFTVEHHALNDAVWQKHMWEISSRYSRGEL